MSKGALKFAAAFLACAVMISGDYCACEVFADESHLSVTVLEDHITVNGHDIPKNTEELVIIGSGSRPESDNAIKLSYYDDLSFVKQFILENDRD